MAFPYKLLPDAPAEMGGKTASSVLRKEDGAFIPKDPDNTDYDEYLEWVAAGNTPEAAD